MKCRCGQCEQFTETIEASSVIRHRWEIKENSINTDMVVKHFKQEIKLNPELFKEPKIMARTWDVTIVIEALDHVKEAEVWKIDKKRQNVDRAARAIARIAPVIVDGVMTSGLNSSNHFVSSYRFDMGCFRSN